MSRNSDRLPGLKRPEKWTFTLPHTSHTTASEAPVKNYQAHLGVWPETLNIDGLYQLGDSIMNFVHDDSVSHRW